MIPPLKDEPVNAHLFTRSIVIELALKNTAEDNDVHVLTSRSCLALSVAIQMFTCNTIEYLSVLLQGRGGFKLDASSAFTCRDIARHFTRLTGWAPSPKATPPSSTSTGTYVLVKKMGKRDGHMSTLVMCS
jgi:hypothetical protein